MKRLFEYRPNKKFIREETAALLARFNGEWKQCPTKVPMKYRRRKPKANQENIMYKRDGP